MNKEQILSELAFDVEHRKIIGDQLDVVFSAIGSYSELSGQKMDVVDISTSMEFMFNGFAVCYIYCKFHKSLSDYVNAIQMKLICWQMAHHTGTDYPVVVCKIQEE